jgi:hypothetical protein
LPRSATTYRGRCSKRLTSYRTATSFSWATCGRPSQSSTSGRTRWISIGISSLRVSSTRAGTCCSASSCWASAAPHSPTRCTTSSTSRSSPASPTSERTLPTTVRRLACSPTRPSRAPPLTRACTPASLSYSHRRRLPPQRHPQAAVLGDAHARARSLQTEDSHRQPQGARVLVVDGRLHPRVAGHLPAALDQQGRVRRGGPGRCAAQVLLGAGSARLASQLIFFLGAIVIYCILP